MKRFGYTAFGTDEGHSEATARLMHMHEGYDAIATSSLSFADEFAAAFNTDKSKLFEAPLPRVPNAYLLDEAHRNRQREAILTAHPQLRRARDHRLLPHLPQAAGRQRGRGRGRASSMLSTSTASTSSTSRTP